MKLVCISDTHGKHRELEMPPGDVLIHCGDATGSGELDIIRDMARWGLTLPYKRKIFVPGNHDFCFDISKSLFKRDAVKVLESKGWTVLIDGVTYLQQPGERELKVFGSPWIPNLTNWAFYDRNRDQFSTAPQDIDILVTHGPPFGIRDGEEDAGESDGWCHYGSKHLLAYVNRCSRLLLHTFGHVHPMGGLTRNMVPWFCNCAVMDAEYRVARNPTVIDLDELRGGNVP
jgi:Icc-related predicted phosphoesterase